MLGIPSMRIRDSPFEMAVSAAEKPNKARPARLPMTEPSTLRFKKGDTLSTPWF